MRAIGDALGPAGEVVLVAGNHDHAIVGRLAGLARPPRGARRRSALDERVAPQYASWIAKRLAGWLAPASRRGRLPGPVAARRRLRDARPLPRRRTASIPTLERARRRARWRGWSARCRSTATPDDYEARARADVRLDPGERAARRAEPALGRRRLGDRRLARARAAPTAGAPLRRARAAGRLPRRRRRRQPRRARPAARRAQRRRRCAAPGSRAIGRGRAAGCGLDARRTSSSATRTAPACSTRDEPGEWRTPARHAACTTPAAGSSRRTSWAGCRAARARTGRAARSRSTTTGRRASSGCSATSPAERARR